MNNIRKYLIEGIVVAIVLIVLLIVMFPRFKKAQYRHKIIKAQINLEETRKAINAYLLEHKFTEYYGVYRFNFPLLTTPVVYLSNYAYTIDPFKMPFIYENESPELTFSSNKAVKQITLNKNTII